MLEFIASNVTIIIIVTFIIMIISAIYAFSNTGPCGNENIVIIDGLITIICIAVLAAFALNTEGDYPVSHTKWKTIYKNNLNADIRIAYSNFSNKPDIITNKKQNIQDFQSALNENNNVINIKLTVTKDENSIVKQVLLEKDNFVAKDVDPKNAQITKIEYRPIEGTAPKVFGIKSKPSKSNQEGEIRITFKSNNNKELDALFKN